MKQRQSKTLTKSNCLLKARFNEEFQAAVEEMGTIEQDNSGNALI